MDIKDAEKVVMLYHKLGNLSQKIGHLNEMRQAKKTGLNPETPGATNYMQQVVRDHWSIFADTFPKYFTDQLDKAIKEAEDEFTETEKELNAI